MFASLADPPRFPTALAVSVLALLLSSCGAGVISGAILGGGDSGGSSPVAEVEPSVTLPVDQGPLDIAPGERFEASAVLSNIDIPPSSQVRVELVVAGQPEVVQEQAEVVLDQSVTDTVRWRLVTDRIRALFPDPTAQDVPVTVRLSARDVGGVVRILGQNPFTLLRKRVVAIENPVEGVVIPVSGGTVTLDVFPRLFDAPQVEVRAARTITTVASLVSREDDPVADTTRIRVAIPAGETPQELGLVVIDRVAGRSVTVHNVFYGPRLLGVTDRSGSSDGEDQISLFGDGLIPLNFENAGAPVRDLDRVELVFRKGPREVVVDSTRLTASTPEALTFRSPASPDGHPGRVSIAVRVQVPRIDGSGGMRIVSDEAPSLFAYAASLANFEPRGITVPDAPRDVDFGALAVAPNDAVSVDAALLFRDPIDGTGRVRVATGNGHGMLRRIGPFVPSGSPGVEDLEAPIDLCVGDFSDDDFLEVVVGHLGTGDFSSISTILGNGEERRGLLSEFQAVFPVNRNTRALDRCDLDRDGIPEVFVSAFADAGLATLGSGARPQWFRELFPLQFLNGNYSVSQPMDLERDGFDDALCIVRQSGEFLLTVRYTPQGLTAFGPYPLTELAPVNGRTTHAVSLGVDGRSALVGLVVLASSQPEELFQLYVYDLGQRDYPVLLEQVDLPPAADGAPFVVIHTMADDIDGDGRIEWVLASREHGLRIYESSDSRLELKEDIGALGEEPIGEVFSLDFAPVQGDQHALYVTHSVGFDTFEETRISTVLTDPASGGLVSTKARLDLEPEQTIQETFSFDGKGGQVGVLLKGEIQTFISDDFGQLLPDRRFDAGDILSSSIRQVSSLNGSGVPGIVFLHENGTVGMLLRDGEAVQLSEFSLLTDFSDFVFVEGLRSGSRIDAGDFDGDGVGDLVALLELARADGSSQFALTFLCGIANPAPGEFPFEVCSNVVNDNLSDATSLTVGNFVLNQGRDTDEIAIAEPSQGVSFYSLKAGAFEAGERESDRRFVSEGRLPDVVRAMDLDGNGADDLVVLSLTRTVVRFYLQQDPRFDGVNVAGFTFADEQPIPVGVSARLEIADVDGDDLDDVILSVVSAMGQPTVGALLWDGTDRTRRAFSVPSARITGADPTEDPEVRGFSFAVADTNRDGAVDIVIGWDAGGFGSEPSYIHTLFGSRR